jgi:hypothetical protein
MASIQDQIDRLSAKVDEIRLTTIPDMRKDIFRQSQGTSTALETINAGIRMRFDKLYEEMPALTKFYGGGRSRRRNLKRSRTRRN